MGENQLKRCQQAADQVTEIMLDNYTKVMDREGKLSDLDERADELRKQTLAQKKRWENVRFKVILVAVVVVVVLVIVLAITLHFTLSGSGNQGAPAQTSTGGGD
ncbi:hypothetical protein E2320_006785 [Naja naja]|nr:hypothetical protein E2320_006785 [Naja naja]